MDEGAGGRRVMDAREQASNAEASAGVRSALQHGKDLWRTVKGLAKQAGLDQKQVEDLLVRQQSDVVRREGKGGRGLYASKERVDKDRQRRAKQRTDTEDTRGPISDEDARTKVRRVLKKARMDPEFPLGRRSIDAILRATKLRRDLDAEQRREYLEALLAGQSDIGKISNGRKGGEILYALKEREDEARVDERDQRRANHEALRALGVEPYPARFNRSDSVSAIVDMHGGRSGEALEGERPETITAGRIVAIRSFGKANFLVLSDGKSRLQSYIREDSVSPRDFDVFRLLDVGDLVGVAGRIFRTRTDELTIWAERLEFLAKSFEPLPEQWNELFYVETRYRQRYLDLIVNPASRKVFETRSRVIRAIRRFLDGRGYLEVETPMMQPMAGGALARPFVTHHNALDLPLYLRVAPELYLKRLVVGGLERVYEINRNFRNEGISTRHNPEFTMLEFYEAYSDYQDLMKFSAELLRETAEAALDGRAKAEFGEHQIDFSALNRLTLAETVAEYWPDKASRPAPAELADIGKIRELATIHQRSGPKIALPDGMSAGAALLKLFEAACEPLLIQPTAVYDYPVEASPLSKQKPSDPNWVERFEIFCGGMEIANGYSELNDPLEQLHRFEEQAAARAAGDHEAHRIDEDYIRALCYGLPPTAGEGIGIDRLTMLLTNSPTIRDVILFPLLRPEGEIGIAQRLRNAAGKPRKASGT
jgi:lysyl-tRNA synthetase class 2